MRWWAWLSDAAPEQTVSSIGERVGIAWLRETCGTCVYCQRGNENLCPNARFTGYDHDGGYAEYAVVREDFAYRLPQGLGEEETAPLLCAGNHRLSRDEAGGRQAGFNGRAFMDLAARRISRCRWPSIGDAGCS